MLFMCYPCVIRAAFGAEPGTFLTTKIHFSARNTAKHAGNALNHVRLTRQPSQSQADRVASPKKARGASGDRFSTGFFPKLITQTKTNENPWLALHMPLDTSCPSLPYS